MSPAQREALAKVAVATEPVKLLSATARILHERYSYIEPGGDGWVLTPRGRASVNAERQRERHHEVERTLPYEARRWAERVAAWLEAHKRFTREQYEARRYAQHVAACDFAGVGPVPERVWPNEDRAYVEETVRSAVRCIEDFDAAAKTAKERGVGISVSYEANEKVPRSRRAAAAAAAEGTVVSLGKYRERRPDRGGAA